MTQNEARKLGQKVALDLAIEKYREIERKMLQGFDTQENLDKAAMEVIDILAEKHGLGVQKPPLRGPK